MTPQRWDQVRGILDTAIAMAPPERAAYLDRACDHDAELRSEVDSLLANHDLAGNFLGDPAVDLKSGSTGLGGGPPRIGRMIGAYQIMEEIGRGGMGEVYRAVRADGQYEIQVAVKLVRVGWNTSSVAERFRHERQILAGLEHPNIARLIDGGTTDDGVPYLVMELVDGEPIDRYCDTHKLGTAERLRLFRDVCAAVQYAHQRLVIHRDIKPSNLLVTHQGQAKLLDFGIARLLGAPTGEPTMMAALTPEFASPEQIRGGVITTATDVYSLGAVLYLLLTGRLPHHRETHAPLELARAICEAEPPRPSAAVTAATPAARNLQRRLRGDLDSIVLKALRKEPGSRYESAERLADDLLRHLDGHAVSARRGSTRYYLGKFVARHRWGVAAAALAMLATIGGVATIVGEARVATVNGERAARRFDDVHQLATSLMFEIHDAIQDLPGAIPARKLLVERAVKYLDSLAREAAGDLPLQRDLAAAYQRIGDVQGDLFHANLGDSAGALRSYEKALALRRAVYSIHPDGVQDGVDLANVLRLHADLLAMNGHIAAAGEDIRRAIAISEPIARARPTDQGVLEETYRDYQDLAGILGGFLNSANLGDQSAAVAARDEQLNIAKRLLALAPADPHLQSLETVAEVNMGDQLLVGGRVREAAAYFSSARDALVLRTRTDAGRNALGHLHAVYTRIAGIQYRDHDVLGALASNRAAFEISARLSAADPKDAYARLMLATDYANVADYLSQTGNRREAPADIAKGIGMIDELIAADPTNNEYRITRGLEYYLAGEIARRGGNRAEALSDFRGALAVFEKALAEDPKNVDARLHVAAELVKVADIMAATGDPGAEAVYREALTRAGADDPAPPGEEARYTIASAYAGLGDIEARAGNQLRTSRAARFEHQAHACQWYERSAGIWAQIREPGGLSPNGFYLSAADALRRAGERCKKPDAVAAAAVKRG